MHTTHVAVLSEELGDQELALRLRLLYDGPVLVRAPGVAHVLRLVALEPLRTHAQQRKEKDDE